MLLAADGAANFSKVSSTGGNKDKGGAGKSDEQLEHARAKISELERKQDEFRERTAAAQKQKAEYQQDIQMRGHLEKKLVALRLVPLARRHCLCRPCLCPSIAANVARGPPQRSGGGVFSPQGWCAGWCGRRLLRSAGANALSRELFVF